MAEKFLTNEYSYLWYTIRPEGLEPPSSIWKKADLPLIDGR